MGRSDRFFQAVGGESELGHQASILGHGGALCLEPSTLGTVKNGTMAGRVEVAWMTAVMCGISSPHEKSCFGLSWHYF